MKKSPSNRVFFWVVASACAGLQGIGCSSSSGQVGNAAGSGGVSGGGGITIDPTQTRASGGSGAQGDAGGAGTAGTTKAEGTCGSATSTANRAPADILIVLDRSASMNLSIAEDCTCGGGGRGGGNPGGGSGPCPSGVSCTTRWSAVSSAVSTTVGADPSLNWGLMFFAAESGGNCGVSTTPQVAISATAASDIQSRIGAATPGSYTPTTSAINAAALYLSTVPDDNNRAILLATDGEPNCANGQGSTTSDLDNTIKAIAGARASGYPVYVVGIGPSLGNLSEMARAGGTGDYYPATSAEQLTQALAQISKIVSSCTFNSKTAPPDPTQIYVYVDKNLINQDPANGWTFGSDATSFVLTGRYCDAILAGAQSQVQIIFGCPGYVPPDIIP
jgi:Mg-chelatase subunit ChlD